MPRPPKGTCARLPMNRLVPPSIQTLAELFLWRCKQDPVAFAYGFIRDNLEITGQLTYETLASRVMHLAKALQERVGPESRVVLIFPPGAEVVIAFWACILAGLTPVPAPPPDPFR